MDRREELMREALREAERGRGRTHPNPVVGALVVRGGTVLSRGHHERAGSAHAEVNALRGAGARSRGADLYVTLEPCNHRGRTPPCTEAILAAGIRRVFVGSRDPNPLVDGRGVRRLREGGIEVVERVLRDECDAANEGWFKFISRRLPWVVLKAAVTLDGKLATRTGDSRWVTGEEARGRVQLWRDQLDAVLVGSGTARADDPRLTVRGVPGGRNPVRVVLDTAARLSPKARLLRGSGSAVVLVGAEAPAKRVLALEKAGARVVACRVGAGQRIDARDALRRLAGLGLTSVLVEGGAAVHGALLRAGLWDELRLFIAPKLAGADGLSWAGLRGPARMAGALGARLVSHERVGDDVLLTLRPPVDSGADRR